MRSTINGKFGDITMITLQPTFIEVNFTSLNKIAAKIRAHKGLISSVQKVNAGRHRIILKTLPTLSLEEIIMAVEEETSAFQEELIIHEKEAEQAVTEPESESDRNENETASSDQLLSLSLNRLKKLGKAQKIQRYTKLSASELVIQLAGKVSLTEIQ